MTVIRDGAFGILIGAAVGTLFLVPAHGSAQDSLSSRSTWVIGLMIRTAALGNVFSRSWRRSTSRRSTS